MNEINKNINRTNWIDICRGIGIILVLLGHNNPPFIKYIFGFHMPFFFLLSGLLFSESAVRDNYYYIKLIKRYICTYYFLALLNLILHIVNILIVTRNPEYISISEIIRWLKGIVLVDVDNMPNCGQLWFLPCLALSLFVFKYIRKINKTEYKCLIIILLIIITHFLQDSILPFRLHTIPIAVIFLEIGFIINKYLFINKSINKSIIPNVFIASVYSLLLFIVGIICISKNLDGSWIDINVARFGYLFLTIIGATAVSTSIFIIISSLSLYFTGCEKIFSYIGKHTLFFLGFDGASKFIGNNFLI